MKRAKVKYIPTSSNLYEAMSRWFFLKKTVKSPKELSIAKPSRNFSAINVAIEELKGTFSRLLNKNPRMTSPKRAGRKLFTKKLMNMVPVIELKET